MALKRTYDVTITTLGPLHIGTNRVLNAEWDYVVRHGKTWVINPDAMLEHFQQPDGSFNEDLIGRPAGELLTDPAEFRPDNPIFRYVLPGTPRSQTSGAELREMYKDVFGRPYIPGSSFKGALRTLLVWGLFEQRNLELRTGELGNSRGWAGQSVERQLMGSNPNYDLGRAIQVADSAPLPTDVLQITPAQVVTGSEKMGSPIELEAVRQDTSFTTTVTLDEYLLSERPNRTLNFGDKWDLVAGLPALGRRWATDYLTRELAWFKQRKYTRVEQLYGQMLGLLRAERVKGGSFFLQIGWGGGWGSKTIGAPLQRNKDEWERLLAHRNLTPARFRRNPGDAFPKSRRLWMAGPQPGGPFGWCLVTMKERK
jgi:CRISPR-associated protein Csm5